MELLTRDGRPVTDQMLDEWADGYENGEWPEGKTIALDPSSNRLAEN